MRAARHIPGWASDRDGQARTVARNVSGGYLAIAVTIVVGLGMLPFNLAHLGTAQHGLRMLVAR